MLEQPSAPTIPPPPPNASFAKMAAKSPPPEPTPSVEEEEPFMKKRKLLNNPNLCPFMTKTSSLHWNYLLKTSMRATDQIILLRLYHLKTQSLRVSHMYK
ncbi:unnamed protein product [Absidia cylindrospora]